MVGESDLFGLPHHPRRRPFGVAAMCARHVLMDRCVAMPRVRAGMAGDADALMQNLDGSVGNARLQLLTDETRRH